MTVEQISNLWELARTIHEARRDLAWGQSTRGREPWPEFTSSYTHHPIAYVDLALASAEAVLKRFKIDLEPSD